MKHGFTGRLLNLIFPPRCAFCGGRLSPNAVLSTCADCSNSLLYCRAYSRCRRCGKPIPEGGSDICRSCLTNRHYVTKITSAFVYADLAKRAIVAFKKETNAWRAGTLALYVAEMVKYDFKNVEFDLVISVPPRIKGINDERFDQAACLASSVARQLDIRYLPKAMVQTGKLHKQSSLARAERLENVKGKFAVRRRRAVAKKTILLIDDVCTSGATLEECAKVLLGCGAYRVYAATLATVI